MAPAQWAPVDDQWQLCVRTYENFVVAMDVLPVWIFFSSGSRSRITNTCRSEGLCNVRCRVLRLTTLTRRRRLVRKRQIMSINQSIASCSFFPYFFVVVGNFMSYRYSQLCHSGDAMMSDEYAYCY